MIIIDFETYSPEPIDAGVIRYSKHPEADIICMAYKIDDAPTQVWTPPSKFPIELWRAILLDGHNLYAHNAFFDYNVWHNIGYKYKLPIVALDRWVDTVALVNRYGFPTSLEKAGEVLNLSIQKQKNGTALIKKICVPTKEGRRPVMGRDYTQTEAAQFVSYCKDDVNATYHLVKALPSDTLAPKEYKIWLLTQKMNLLGLPIDTETADKIFMYIDGFTEDLVKTMPKLTDGMVQKPTQAKRIIEWCETQGLKLDNLQAGTVDQLMAQPDLPSKIRKVMQLRQMLGRSSTAKYRKISEMVYDGRVHGNLQYHGAHTGRWAGRGLQLQNLPRAKVKDPEKYIQAFRNFESVEDPVNVAKALIRPMICAPPGRTLIVADYSSIENRVLAYCADDTATLKLFKQDLDQYKDMASFLYNTTYEAVTKDQRQLGKVIVLGCIAQGTRVLTKNGVKPIEYITLRDKVWDGISWVSHTGLAVRGIKECIKFNGIWLTSDHEVFVTQQKEEVWRHAGNTQSENQAICLAIGELLNSFPELSLLNAMLVIESDARYAELSIIKFWRALKKVIQQNVENAAEKPNTNLDYGLIAELRVSIKTLSIALSTDGMPLKRDVLFQQLLNIRTMGAEAFKCVKNGYKLLDLLLNMLWDYPDLTIPASNWIESTTTGITSPVISNLLLVPKTVVTNDDGKNKLTYDITNAGPRQRFTIITPRGPMLVSNCGFGMGGNKFQAVAQGWGIELSTAEAAWAVDAYRSKYPKVKQLWYTARNAMVNALRSPGSVFKINHVATVKYAKDRNGTPWLIVMLCSGRSILYYKPFIDPEGGLGYHGINPYSKKFDKLRMTPGTCAQNIVQASARDCMAEGLLNVEARMPEIDLIGAVHDEALGETDEERGNEVTLAEFNKNLCDIPWAPGLPVKAEGYIAKRYRK